MREIKKMKSTDYSDKVLEHFRNPRKMKLNLEPLDVVQQFPPHPW